jgi:FAD/FMN-containing dehydrogenase
LQQADVDPACIFLPSVNTDVSVLVLLSRLTQCPFAAKSGGHAAMKGASNIPNGITVSFEKLKKISLAKDKKSVVIQPGNNWGEVYKTLNPKDVTVTGGRVSVVGTGGLTLGGE